MNTKVESIVDILNGFINKPVVVTGFYTTPYTGVVESMGKKAGTMSVRWDEDKSICDVPFNYIALAGEFAETEEDIYERIARKFATLERMSRGIASGKLTGMIVSGPGGVGKTFTLEEILEKYAHKDDVDRITGHITPLALYEKLYENSAEGKITVFDDCDSVFDSDKTLNILKAALDSRPYRVISWDSRSLLQSAPPSFLFKGHIVFITNKVLAGPHYEALLTRVHHVNMHMDNREILTRIRQVAGYVDHRNATPEDKEVVLNFLNEHVAKLKDVLSIRSFLKLLDLYLLCESDYSSFKSLAYTQLID